MVICVFISKKFNQSHNYSFYIQGLNISFYCNYINIKESKLAYNKNNNQIMQKINSFRQIIEEYFFDQNESQTKKYQELGGHFAQTIILETKLFDSQNYPKTADNIDIAFQMILEGFSSPISHIKQCIGKVFKDGNEKCWKVVKDHIKKVLKDQKLNMQLKSNVSSKISSSTISKISKYEGNNNVQKSYSSFWNWDFLKKAPKKQDHTLSSLLDDDQDSRQEKKVSNSFSNLNISMIKKKPNNKQVQAYLNKVTDINTEINFVANHRGKDKWIKVEAPTGVAGGASCFKCKCKFVIHHWKDNQDIAFYADGKGSSKNKALEDSNRKLLGQVFTQYPQYFENYLKYKSTL